MRNNRILVLNLLLLLISPLLFAQNTLKISVQNDAKEAMEFPEILIPHKLHKVGTINGELNINKNILNTGDSLIVKFMGYETAYLEIDSKILLKDRIEVNLKESSFLLNTLVVGRNDFDAEGYFKKKKKSLLLPYYKAHLVDMNFEQITESESNDTTKDV